MMLPDMLDIQPSGTGGRNGSISSSLPYSGRTPSDSAGLRWTPVDSGGLWSHSEWIPATLRTAERENISHTFVRVLAPDSTGVSLYWHRSPMRVSVYNTRVRRSPVLYTDTLILSSPYYIYRKKNTLIKN